MSKDPTVTLAEWREAVRAVREVREVVRRAEQLDFDTFESEEGERRPWRAVEDTKPL